VKVLLVGGLDPSAGAGLAADLEALWEVGARGLPVAAALTAQGPRGARAFRAVPPAFLLAQLDALLQGAAPAERPRAVKVGMLGSAANAAALARRLGRPPLAHLPVVLDPVLAATSGLQLLPGPRPARALGPLLRRATLVTPNRAELAALSGRELRDDAAAIAAARALPCRAVLVKGGHRQGPPLDLLVEPGRVTRFRGRRRPGTARGTGCRLASAIAGLLAEGAPLAEAVREAKRLVERYLDQASAPVRPGRAGRAAGG
jgi:hydroxymethylpyrimidine/phosphomethylpyrimidine kinase